MEFFQTIMGKRFFEKQLPDLIKALKKRTAAVEKNNRLREEEKNENL